MRRFILLIVAFVTVSFTCQARESVYIEPETTSPMYGTEIERYCYLMDIEHKTYHDVKVIIESNNPDYVWTTKHKVHVKVIDLEGKVIYKKTFKNSYLYVFSSGQIQIGMKNFNKVIIRKSMRGDDWYGEIREKEGVY